MRRENPFAIAEDGAIPFIAEAAMRFDPIQYIAAFARQLGNGDFRQLCWRGTRESGRRGAGANCRQRDAAG